MTAGVTARILRASAVLLVILAVVDPSLSLERRSIEEVAVVTGSLSDSTTLARVHAAIPPEFSIVSTPTATTDATVVVGAATPDEVGTRGPLLVLTPPARSTTIGFTEIDLAPVIAAGTAAVVRVRGRVSRAVTPQVTLALHSGDVTLDALELTLPDRSAWFDTTLVALPTTAGPWPLRVTARSANDSAAWDLLTVVRSTPWRVLVHDARPSWMSTFVRRTLEHDPRFTVSHRVATAPTVLRSAGAAPASLSAADAFRAVDVVVIGAPDALPDADVRALGQYLRRGGAVVLLVDSLAGRALAELSGIERWREQTGLATMLDQRGRRLRGARIVAPIAATPALEPVMTGAGRVGVWRRSVGRGSLWISTVRDAWQSREASRSDFAVLWPERIEDAALSALGALAAELERAVLPPGDSTHLVVSLPRDGGLDLRLNDERLTLDGVGPRASIRVVAPITPGLTDIVLRTATDTLRVPLHVRADARRDRVADTTLLHAWAIAKGGTTLPLDAVDALGTHLRAMDAAGDGSARWHPMRRPWWIVVLTALLGAEWSLRRRRGLA